MTTFIVYFPLVSCTYRDFNHHVADVCFDPRMNFDVAQWISSRFGHVLRFIVIGFARGDCGYGGMTIVPAAMKVKLPCLFMTRYQIVPW